MLRTWPMYSHLGTVSILTTRPSRYEYILMFHVLAFKPPDRSMLDSTSTMKPVGQLEISINCVSEGSIRDALKEKGEAK